MQTNAFSGCSKEEIHGNTPGSGSTETETLDLSSFTASDLGGKAVSGEIFKTHRLNMINIWATFCGPCIREMPDLQALSEEHAEDLQIIGIILDITDRNYNIVLDIKQEALKIIEQTGVRYDHLIPSKSLNSLLLSDVQAVPVTVFVDREGRMVGSAYAGSRSKKDWETIITKLLEEVR